jgi:hypothetical protein
MSRIGLRNRAPRCPQRPATTTGGINTPDDPSLCGPSTRPHTRTVRESGGWSTDHCRRKKCRSLRVDRLLPVAFGRRVRFGAEVGGVAVLVRIRSGEVSN